MLLCECGSVNAAGGHKCCNVRVEAPMLWRESGERMLMCEQGSKSTVEWMLLCECCCVNAGIMLQHKRAAAPVLQHESDGLHYSSCMKAMAQMWQREKGCINMLPTWATSREVLPTFGTFCPVRIWVAQTIDHFAHFEVQVLMATHHAVTVPMPWCWLSSFYTPLPFTWASR